MKRLNCRTYPKDNDEKTIVEYTEHYDELESNGNAATKYIIKFNKPVNCDWLRQTLDNALKLKQFNKE